MARLTKKDIVAAADLKPVEIEVPEWGGSVLLRGLTGAERDRFEDESTISPDKKGGAVKMNLVNFRARLVARCVVDEQGKRMFEDAEVEVLGGKSALALNRLFELARKMSGITDDDVKEMEKGFTAGPSGASTSA